MNMETRRIWKYCPVLFYLIYCACSEGRGKLRYKQLNLIRSIVGSLKGFSTLKKQILDICIWALFFGYKVTFLYKSLYIIQKQ